MCVWTGSTVYVDIFVPKVFVAETTNKNLSPHWLDWNMPAAVEYGKKPCVCRYYVNNDMGINSWRNTRLLEVTLLACILPNLQTHSEVLYGLLFLTSCMTSCTRWFASARPSIDLIKCSIAIFFSFHMDVWQFFIALIVFVAKFCVFNFCGLREPTRIPYQRKCVCIRYRREELQTITINK